MSYDDFVKGYPTPDYVKATWSALHANFCSETMLAWESACQMARNEAYRAWEEGK